ncbi:MAG TPA: polyhydroxyalkanoate synthesis regulator DNA-binding domain-containing protein [Candidatus Binatia bacterium]|nr:polyhydroxyalkanoate synthesis regulator DNA-binding domain-containing protein [Candidatus Binatia bacterium]
MARVVKRYSNRKLYDTTTSRYVALDDIAAMVRAGEEVEVTDNETGTDLTAVTLAQIILEEERRRSSFLSLSLLRELVRSGGSTLADVTNRSLEALGEMREAAGRRVSEMVSESSGRPAIFDEMLTSSRRRIEELQQRVDQGLKSSLERLRNAPGIGVDLERIESGLRDLELRVKRLLARENGTAESPGDGGNAAGSDAGDRSSNSGHS